MPKIYKIERYVHGKKANPVYVSPVFYENLVDLTEDLAMSYYSVYVAGSEDLLNAIKATALLYYPIFHKGMTYTIWSSKTIIPYSPALACVVSEVDQNGNLLSASS